MKYLFKGKPTERFEWIISNRDPMWENHMKDGYVYGSLVEDKNRCYICIRAIASNSSINNGITTMVEVEPKSVKRVIVKKIKARLV